ncbi:MAG: DUF2911 domain-containing protein [Ignavibacteriaceae bacterium]
MKNLATTVAGIYFIVLFFVFLTETAAQPRPIPVPDASQEAMVMQKIGLTDITISYHRPAVNGRAVWGKLVPYNQVWRAGANENTTITFSDPVKIDGKIVPAGSYGLHMIPTENEWTIILNTFSKSWGSFFYREEDDQLRFTVKPVAAEFMEYLNYNFETSDPNKTQVVLRWDKLKVPFEVEVDIHEIVINNLKDDLRFINGFFWQPHQQAAMYCINNDVHLENAAQWADRAIQLNRNFSTLTTKSLLLDKQGKTKESEDILKEAYGMATEVEVNNFGYVLLGAAKTDKAIEVFKFNVEKFPDSWNVYDSLAEAYMNKGENKLAKEYYQKALDKVKDENQKTRILNTLNDLASN